MGEGAKETENVEEPENDGDHDDAVENRLDGPLHGDVGVHEPEQNPDDDQDQDDVDEGHENLRGQKIGQGQR